MSHTTPSTQRTFLKGLLDDAHARMTWEQRERIVRAGYEPCSPAQASVFRHVDERGARIGELAQRNRISAQAFGQHVAHLERLGYVERVADPDDGRAKIVRLTARGSQRKQVALDAMADIERDWQRRVGATRMAELRAALESLR
jgi:DNA-binding MarR family transcriptional regulator